MELKLEGITKSYTKGKKRKNALEDFTLTLTEGVYGLLGPNGAGKSTLINIITGIIGRDSGSISFTDGNDNSFLSHLGFMPQGMDFYRNFTAKDYIKYIMALKKYSPDNADEYALTTLGKVNLRADADKKIGAFSGGMKQRLGIGMALVGEPDLLLLDEPINGLDPQGIAEIRDMIFKLRDEQNMTIIISSHILEELSKIATHYGIIHNGTLVQEITKEELMQRCGERMEIFLDDPKQALPVLDQMGFKNYQVTDKNTIHIYERLDESAAVNMELAKAGVSVRGIGITSEELENYFLNLTGGACNA